MGDLLMFSPSYLILAKLQRIILYMKSTLQHSLLFPKRQENCSETDLI